MLQTIEEFTTGIEWLFSSQIQDLENDLTSTNFLWPNLWNRLKSLSGVRCTTLAKSKKISTIIKCIHNKLPVLAVLNKRKPELYERAWCITCDSQIVETQAHLTNCRGYEAKWQEIEAQVSQILWNSLEQNLQRKISLEKLASWLYGETQDQKEAIREEIIRNLTRKKTEKTLYETCRKNNTVQQVLTLWLDLSWNLL